MEYSGYHHITPGTLGPQRSRQMGNVGNNGFMQKQIRLSLSSISLDPSPFLLLLILLLLFPPLKDTHACRVTAAPTGCPVSVQQLSSPQSSQMFGPLPTCCWVTHQRPISTPKENSHSCTLDDEHCSASQVLHSFVLLLISFISAGAAPGFATNFGHVGEHLGKKAIRVTWFKMHGRKKILLFCWIVNRTRWWKKWLFNFPV